MFLIEKKNKAEIIALYTAEIHQDEPSENSIQKLANLFSLLKVTPSLVSYPFYWDYLDLILIHIHTGQWTMNPHSFFMKLDRQQLKQPMSPSLIRCKAASYNKHAQNIIRRYGGNSKTVATHWLNNENGFHDMLLSAYIMTQIHDILVQKLARVA